VLYGGYSRGRNRLGSEAETAQADALLTLFRQGFAPENRTVRQMLKYSQFPGGTPEQLQWFNDLQQAVTSPENAVRIRQATFDIDVSPLLPQVKAPTLVLHSRDDPAVPFEEGRRIAAGIPGSRFVTLDSPNHLLLEGEPSWPRLRDAIRNFLND
jgi:pimeloyl-ACP methyl ester carboxylesterase